MISAALIYSLRRNERVFSLFEIIHTTFEELKRRFFLWADAPTSERRTAVQQLLNTVGKPQVIGEEKTPTAFGVDLALPKVGEGARKTNHDYTHGKLDDLIEVTIKHGAKLFVSAVGVPPAHTIKRLHEAGILVMNMVGAPKHAEKALAAGVDIVCAQGGEGGGHTGDVPFSILIPAVVDVARKYKSPLTGQPALVVAAGGVSDGRSLAASLMLGASGVWVGTRFVASDESGASRMHKEAVVDAGFGDTVTTLVVSGRPLRVLPNDYIKAWQSKPEEIKRLTDAGVVPIMKDFDEGKDVDIPFLMGHVAAVVKDIKPAGQIVEEMVKEAVHMLKVGHGYLKEGNDLERYG
ncbi:conserved hypothetical protein [Histoplasma mississippiense (nom. inval.)]|uniref:conserved hypothetical protein n=1 Tax=Ajellomyces capsulatus (strain NAm1 / WU24) TaxID=2059318 RepID=UPI000157C426|nr:conserved hypothetical protein [Histoplasma mississippiense (nom. inval.)]EDN07740.1 conserved hypothetical protein [Histoplasma mississippiense (nom. inval.)]